MTPKSSKIAAQKALASDLLKKLYVIEPGVVVAGGAPRDWYLDEPARDIDIFLYIADSAPFRGVTFERIARALGIDRASIEIVADGDPDYKTNPDIRWVFNISCYDTPVQIIAVRELTHNGRATKNFPVSTSKIWMSSDVWVEYDPLFKISMDKQIIFRTHGTFVKDVFLDKTRARFPDFTWVQI